MTWTGTFTSTWTRTLTPTYTGTPTRTTTGTTAPTFTLTSTATPTAQEIVDIKPYPNPVNPGRDVEVRIGFKIAQQDIDTLIIRIYTSGYRLIKEVKLENTEARQVAAQGYITIDTKELKTLANSAYYYYIRAERKGEVYKSMVDKMVILR
jgi:hypothetical protein